MTWNPGIQRFLETVCSGNCEKKNKKKNEPVFKRCAEHMQKCRSAEDIKKIPKICKNATDVQNVDAHFAAALY